MGRKRRFMETPVGIDGEWGEEDDGVGRIAWRGDDLGKGSGAKALALEVSHSGA
jgi:hypothetical protein